MWHFLASHIWTILGLVASFGAIGIAVAVLAFGVPAALILAHVAGFAREAVRFLSTPTGQAVAVIALCLVSFAAGDIRRTRLDDAAWRAREEKAARALAEREARIARETAADAAQRMAALAHQANDLQQKVTDYERTLSARDDRACLATADDVRSLRGLAPEAGPPAGRARGRLRTAPRPGSPAGS
jgi:multidrug resistance efflux pump